MMYLVVIGLLVYAFGLACVISLCQMAKLSGEFTVQPDVPKGIEPPDFPPVLPLPSMRMIKRR